MRLLPRLLILLALGWLLAVLIYETRHLSPEADQTKVILLFGGSVLVGLSLGVLVAFSLLPMLGDWVGSFFFNPNEEVEKNPHSEAMALVAQGEYAEAIEAYGKVLEKNPGDLLALSEMVHLYCDKLQQPEPAAQLLEEALGSEWPQDDAAFLASRLVDVYWTYQHNAKAARPLLLQIAETMPDTKHAANAMHRLREIEHALETGVYPEPHKVLEEQ